MGGRRARGNDPRNDAAPLRIQIGVFRRLWSPRKAGLEHEQIFKRDFHAGLLFRRVAQLVNVPRLRSPSLPPARHCDE